MKRVRITPSVEYIEPKGKTREEIVQEGICYPKKDKMRKPMKSFLTAWDSAMFDHHMKILCSTTLSSLFPELEPIETAHLRKKASALR